MPKCSIFVSAICSSIFGGNDWTLAESTLSVFGCVCVCWCGGGGVGGDVGAMLVLGVLVLVVVVMMVGVVVMVVVMVMTVAMLEGVGGNFLMACLWSSHWRLDAFLVSRK